VSCRADEAARLRDVKNTTRNASVVSDVVGAKASCNASWTVQRIVLNDSEAYFGTSVRCPVTTKMDPASFTAAMEQRGWYGWHLVDGVVLGGNTSRSYRSCEPLPRGQTACEDDATDTRRLEGMLFASLGSSASCEAEHPSTITTASDHYYSANVSCTVRSTREAASFAARMKAYGWNGWTISGNTVTGTQTSRVCSSYGGDKGAAAGE